jgi:hypothetical protein
MATEAETPAEQPLAQEFHITKAQRPWLIVRTFLLSTLMTVEAWGVYTIFLETGIRLGVHIGSFNHAVIIGGLVATNTTLWHHLVKDPFVRHGIRKLTESMFAGVVALAYGLNPFTKRLIDKRSQGEADWSKLDRFEIKVLHAANYKDNVWRANRGLPAMSGKQVLGAAGLAVLYAGSASAALLYLASKIGSNVTISAFGPGFARFFQEIWTGPIAYTIIGFLVVPLAKRPFAPVWDDFQQLLAAKWVAVGRTMRWYHRHILFTPQFIHRIALIEAKGGQDEARKVLSARGRGLKFAMAFGFVLFLGFLAVGAKVRITGSFYA